MTLENLNARIRQYDTWCYRRTRIWELNDVPVNSKGWSILGEWASTGHPVASRKDRQIPTSAGGVMKLAVGVVAPQSGSFAPNRLQPDIPPGLFPGARVHLGPRALW
jgi:hypothetical protein